MPKLPMDYSKCVIYKIVCKDLSKIDVYVGSTTDFVRRKACHKYDCNTENSKNYNCKLYQYIRENGGWDNFTIVIIEQYPCNNYEEARTRERYWYETLNANLNSFCPTLNIENQNDNAKRYRDLNKEHKRDYYKQRYQLNKESILDYQKQYNELNKESIRDYKKQYNELNKEHKRDYAKRYRELKKINNGL